jgi:hypothetical protein
MIIIGYKGTPDWPAVKAAFKRCTDMDSQEIAKVISDLKSGKVVSIANDFVLHDELKDLGFTLK